MKKKRVKNPLFKRVFKELIGDWKKYLVVSLSLIFIIGIVSGMLVANDSMLKAAEDSVSKYKLEYGHFELNKMADEELLSAIESGEKADVKQYYLDEAKAELDEKFDSEFTEEFTKEFDQEFTEQFNAEFTQEFDTMFEKQIEQTLLAQGMDSGMAETMLSDAIAQAKQSGSYQTAYDSAYEEAYQEAYDKAYDEAYDAAYEEAYDKAWKEIEDEIDEEYAKAEEKYELNDPDFRVVPVTLYENFYRNEDEDYNNDGTVDATLRIYAQNEDINQACLMEGRFPESEDEIAIDRMHANSVGVKIGDTMTISGKTYEVVGFIAYVNYSTLHEKSTDLMFDALNFGVAMVTDEGFNRLSKSIHYAYAWLYEQSPEDETEEKHISDDFLKVLLTQAVTCDNEIEDYVPRYANPAINFATDDMGSDETMVSVLLDILIVIIAFIFGVTISNTITKEASAIGTLRASGYTKGELIRHYLSMPVIVTFVSAVIGNLLGYTVAKDLVAAVYYNSYSLPTYETVWNATAFLKTTLIPVALMLAVNLIVIIKMMQHTPLQFLRHDLKKKKQKKAMRLPNWKFMNRFRLRIIFQNIPNYFVLFVGILFVSVLLAMGVGIPSTLSYYKENAVDMMFANYQYVLKDFEDEDGELIQTETKDAEKFSMCSLRRKSDAIDEEVSVYGILEDSRYVKIAALDSLGENEAYISESYSEKYNVKIGDTISLDEKYENQSYQFTVSGIYDRCQSIAVFLPIDNYRAVFETEQDAFTGYLSNVEITDLAEDDIATVITEKDITKMCDQLDRSMGAIMTYYQYLCLFLSVVLIYLLTKIIIEKNETAISMTKILGYENRELASLYLLSTTMIVILSDAVGIFIGAMVLVGVWKAMMAEYSGWIGFIMEPAGYVKMFLIILIGYLIVMVLDFRRIKKIPMDEALKNAE